MSYDPTLYDLDPSFGASKAALKDGAILYRLTAPTWCDRGNILTGLGPEKKVEVGRFNRPQQRTSYCSNNVLVCISEVLYHMYRRALKVIIERQPYSVIRNSMVQQRMLVALNVNPIKDLVLLESQDVCDMYGTHLSGTMLVFPDQQYEPLVEFADSLRTKAMRGVVYPSARHSMDFCLALFHDESTRIKGDVYEILGVKLQLVTESQDPAIPPTPPDASTVRQHKLHATMGYYRFEDSVALDGLRSSGILHPSTIPSSGMVDFVRRRYVKYADDAVRS